MKPFSGYEAKNTVVSSEMLPAGCYVVSIIGAKEESGQYGSRLIMQVEIIEGEFAGFFRKQFDAQANSSFGQKYKGVYRLRVPADDGSEQDQWSKQSFNGAMWAIEQSNTNYKWDWNEANLKNKVVGIAVREHTKTFDSGNRGTYTEIAYLVPVEDVRSGKAKTPKAKVDPDTNASTFPAPAPAAGVGFTPVETDELPF